MIGDTEKEFIEYDFRTYLEAAYTQGRLHERAEKLHLTRTAVQEAMALFFPVVNQKEEQ